MEKYKDILEYFLFKVGEYTSVKSYRKDDIIFNEGDVEENLYIIKSGKVEIYKVTKNWDERLVFILTDGAILNEEVLFSSGSMCTTSCRAYDSSKIIVVPKKVVLEEIQKDFKSMEYIFKCTSTKLQRTYRQLKNSGTNVTIDKKIASKLWKMGADFGIETRNGIYIDISLSSTLISKMIGAKRETVSRCINKLKKDGLIEIDGDRITILDKMALLDIIEKN